MTEQTSQHVVQHASNRHRIIIASIVGSVLLVSLACLLGYLTEQRDQAAINAQRQHVFCQLLKPGMTHDEVDQVLSQFGQYRQRRADFSPGFYTIWVNYLDPATDHRFGGNIILTFRDSRYYSAAIPTGDGEFAGLCEQGK
jgi:hypothetical protein